MGALGAEIVGALVQRMPQVAGCYARRAMTALAPEDMHGLADPVERELSILGLTVPDPPVQALDLRDDRCLRLDPTRLVGRQSAGCLLRVLQPHGEVEPVRDGVGAPRRWLGGHYRDTVEACRSNSTPPVATALPERDIVSPPGR